MENFGSANLPHCDSSEVEDDSFSAWVMGGQLLTARWEGGLVQD